MVESNRVAHEQLHLVLAQHEEEGIVVVGHAADDLAIDIVAKIDGEVIQCAVNAALKQRDKERASSSSVFSGNRLCSSARVSSTKLLKEAVSRSASTLVVFACQRVKFNSASASYRLLRQMMTSSSRIWSIRCPHRPRRRQHLSSE